jgi:hypothetical protein
MIGRPAVLDPCIFNRLKGITCPDKEAVRKEYMALSQKYDEPFKYAKNYVKHQEESEFPQG